MKTTTDAERVTQPSALVPFATMEVRADRPIELGLVPGGGRRQIPILGGTIRGDGVDGELLAGGADWQLVVTERLVEIEARQIARLDDGTLLEIESLGLRVAEPADVQRIARGEFVDPNRVYFRTAVRITTAATDWAWLNERLFLGAGARLPDRVVIDLSIVT